jgi:hypothetical protein
MSDPKSSDAYQAEGDAYRARHDTAGEARAEHFRLSQKLDRGLDVTHRDALQREQQERATAEQRSRIEAAMRDAIARGIVPAPKP